MPLNTLTEQEIAAAAVSALPLNPTASSAFGGRDYTPTQMKEAFDRLPRLIAERLNALISALTEGEILGEMPVTYGETRITLRELCEMLKEHLDTLSVYDDAPAQGSANSVTSDGIYTALLEAVDKATEAAGKYTDQAVRLALRGQKVTYDAEKGTLLFYCAAGESPYESVPLPIPGIEEALRLFSTLLGASVLSETLEDAFSIRETAGGLPVLDYSPTIVHKIAGETKASANLFDLSVEGGSASIGGLNITTNNNKWTVSGTPDGTFATLKEIDIPSYFGGKTVTISSYGGSVGGMVGVHPINLVLARVEDGAVVEVLARTDFGGTSDFATLKEGYTYRLAVLTSTADPIDDNEQTVSFMVNIGSEALPYEDYYAGTKNASFQGVVSTGRNLLDLSADGGVLDGISYSSVGNTFTISGTPTVNYVALKTVTLPASWGGKTITISQSKYYEGSTGYKTLGAVYFLLTNMSNGENFASYQAPKTVTLEEGATYRLRIQTGSYAGSSFDEQTVSFMINIGSEALPYEDYVADTSFSLDAPVTLGRWDYIDPQNQTITRGTVYTYADAPFEDDMIAYLAPSGDYVLSADGLSLASPAYPEDITTEPFACPKQYTVWRNGTETVIQGDEDNSAFGAVNTITQSYYVKAGGDAS